MSPPATPTALGHSSVNAVTATSNAMADGNTSKVYTSRGPVEGENWSAVAEAVNRRMAERRVGQQQLAELSGVSVSTIRLVQHGAGRRVQNKTLAAIARGLGWPDDYLVRVLLTGQLGADAPAEPTIGDLYDVLCRIEAQLVSMNERIRVVEQAVGAGAGCGG